MRFPAAVWSWDDRRLPVAHRRPWSGRSAVTVVVDMGLCPGVRPGDQVPVHRGVRLVNATRVSRPSDTRETAHFAP